MMYRITIVGSLLIVGLILLSCSDKSSGPNNQNPPTQQSIGPEGGTIQITGEVTLTIPAGALSDTIQFSITRDNSPTLPGGTMRYVSNCYSIKPNGTQFAAAAGLTLKYSHSLLGRGSENAIAIYTYDSSACEPMITSIDTAGNIAVAAIHHLSNFGAIVDTGTVSNGIYAALVAGRNIMVMDGMPMRVDMFVARFDSAYAPCNPVSPVRADSVFCNAYQLSWDQSLDEFKYFDLYHQEIINLGAIYIFRIRGNTEIPNLTAAITFPSEEPFITSPANYDTLSLSGFTVNWINSGNGTVRFVLMRDNDSTNVNLETSNDGSYSFTSSQLSGLQAGDYGLIMIHQNSAAINIAGYDSRGVIWARVINTTIYHIQ
jgi:hypothetical protein